MRRGSNDRDLGESEDLAESGRRFRWVLPSILVAALAIAAFLISLAATLPARIASEYVAAPFQLKDVTGTIWTGGGGLGGGHRVGWSLDGFGSIAARAPVLDVTVTGPGTELAARVTARFGNRRVTISGLTGQAGWPLVALVAPDLEITCDLTASPRDVAIDVAPGSYAGTGGFTAGPGTCARVDGGESVPVPALVGALSTIEEGLRGGLSTAADPGTPLAEVLLANRDALVVTVYPAGAALVPGMPASSETVLEYPLSGYLR